MMPQEAAIVVKSLSRSFPGVKAVDRLDIEVSYGEVFGLVGPDGAGKTTTMRMLAGVLAPDNGSAIVAGFDVVREPELVKRRISYMSQRFGLYEDLTVEENIRFYADVFGVRKAERIERAARLLQAADMAPFRSRLAGKLSGGMKQKLGLICALIHTPRVLLLDEPTNGVDPVSRRDFWKILYSLLSEGVAIVTSTAYLDEAERCHRIALLHQGQLLFCDTPASLKKRLTNTVIAITSNSPRRVCEVVQHQEGVSSATLVGDGVHLIVDDAERRLPQLRLRLDDERVQYDVAERVGASVEDVFVNAVAQETEASK